MAFVERKLRIMDWKTENTKVRGILLSADRRKFDDGGSSMFYTVVEQDGGIVGFPGATQLDMRLFRDDIGADVEITYLGEDTTRKVTENRSRPKLFKVLIDASTKPKEPVPPQASHSPADDDFFTN